MDDETQNDDAAPEGLLSGEALTEESVAPAETPAHLVEETDSLVEPAEPVTAEPPAERPENIPEQFWKDDKVDVDGLAKSYSELRTKMSQGKHKPPKDGKYDFSDSGLDAEDPLVDQFVDLARDEGLSQDLVMRLAGLYTEANGALDQQIQFKRDEEMAKLGRNGEAVIKTMDDWLGRMAGAGVLSEGELQAIATASTNATFISALNKIRRSYNEPGIPSTENMEPDSVGLDDVQSMMQDPRYGEDQAYTRKVERAVYEMHGEKAPKFARH
jgi:hypothetical protein